MKADLELIEYLDGKFKDLEEHILGDGSGDKPGLNVRVDRLEQTGKKLWAACWFLLVTAAAKLGVDLTLWK